MDWPDDADGDVLRRMQESGFDFDREAEIDFNIDFSHWPLSQEEVNQVKKIYPYSEIIDPTEEDKADGMETGYVQFTIQEKLTYELVINTQEKVTKQMHNIGGWCESWGAFH